MELDHVGIAVHDLERARTLWKPLLGEADGPVEAVPSNRVRVAFYRTGGTEVELLEPTAPDSPVGRFLSARGEGFHHLAFRVPSVEKALADVEARGGKVVDRQARPGARGRKVGFAHPSSFGGVLVEFVEGG